MPSPFKNPRNKPIFTTTTPLLKFKPSVYQEAIFKEAVDGDGNVIVNAVAGSGKSTTIEGCFSFVPRDARVIAVAFNVPIAQALQARAPSGVEAATLNSVGWRSWLSFNGRCEVDKLKVNKIAREQVVPFIDRADTSTVIALVKKAKVHCLVPDIVRSVAKVEGLMADTSENWLSLARRYDIDLPFNFSKILDYARNTLARSVTLKAMCDFDDQLYMPIIYGASFTKYDVIFVDETQDLSDIQQEMLRRMGKPTTRYFFVGDRRQSLYAFRGADSYAMDRIKANFSCKEMPLSISYRCPRKVVEYAKRYEPAIEPAPNAIEGVVEQKGKADAADYRYGDMVLCRYNAPIMKLAYALIRRGQRVRVQGRDVAEGMKALVKQLKATNAVDLLERLTKWEANQVSLMLANDDEEAIEALRDKTECLRTVVEGSNAKTVADVETAIESLFGGTGACVLLSSVHRAKGLEADNVWIIDHHVMPKSAKTPEQVQQEINIKYVAVTRAKKALYFVSST